MTYLVERRKYQRCYSSICNAHLSTDRKQWLEVDITDISAGGLKFSTYKEYAPDDLLHIDLHVYNMLSEFNVKFEGKVIRHEVVKGQNVYSIKFINVNRSSQIQLDEVIESKITVKNYKNHIDESEDGVYTFLLMPKVKPRKLHIRF
ncbi:MAG: PilZ domain-containing protein [Clostridia bacterium]|nr:PilZ domain-containing protein [Clostridia bacterium]